MKNVKNLIFDVGNVLIAYRWHDMLTKDRGLDKKDADRVGKEVFDDPKGLWHQYDLGNISYEEIVRLYCEEFPQDAADIKWFFEHEELLTVDRKEVWELVHGLKLAGFRIYLLSNYPDGLFQLHTENTPFIKDVDGMIVSYMIHKGKPDPEIYEELLSRYSLKPEECLFFDDRKENVEAAEKLGIGAVQVCSEEGMVRTLRELLKEAEWKKSLL